MGKIVKTTACQFLKDHEWTQHAYARKAAGDVCSISDPKACSFCIYGVLNTVYGGSYLAPGKKVMNLARERYGSGDLVSINDHPDRTKEEIVALLCEAGV